VSEERLKSEFDVAPVQDAVDGTLSQFATQREDLLGRGAQLPVSGVASIRVAISGISLIGCQFTGSECGMMDPLVQAVAGSGAASARRRGTGSRFHWG
jgi:hypothetical protein